MPRAQPTPPPAPSPAPAPRVTPTPVTPVTRIDGSALPATRAEANAAGQRAYDNQQTAIRQQQRIQSDRDAAVAARDAAPAGSPERATREEEVRAAEARLAEANTQVDNATHNITALDNHFGTLPEQAEGGGPGGVARAGAGGSTREGTTGQGGDEFKFSNNSLGQAGNRVAETIRRCGNEDGQTRCRNVAKSLEAKANYSDYSDYVSYAAVAGTIGPALLLDSDQKDDQKTAATIQNVAGYANIAAGAVDVAIGFSARGNASELNSVKQSQSAICNQVSGAASWRPSGQAARPQCERFGNGRQVTNAADEVKSAANSHFIYGGLKAVAGVAGLYLASESEKNAKHLESLEQKKAEDAKTDAAAVGQVTIGAPTATNTANAVGFTATEPTEQTVTNPTNTSPRALTSGGASVAPGRGGSGLPPGYARRGGGNSPALASAGGRGGLSTGGAAATSAEGDGTAAAAAPEQQGSDWVGGGGALNRGGMELGGGDGGFANLLGQMTQGLTGNGPGGPAPIGEFGRNPSSSGGEVAADQRSEEQPNISLFERVSHTIDRQIRSGNVVNSVTDVNKL